MKKLQMRERRVLVKAFAAQYRRATKQEKGEILERFVEASDYNAARLLRHQGRRVKLKSRVVLQADVSVRWGRRGRRRIYGEGVKRALMAIWQMLDYLCGKRLAPALPGAVEALERHEELDLSTEVREALLDDQRRDHRSAIGRRKEKVATEREVSNQAGDLTAKPDPGAQLC